MAKKLKVWLLVALTILCFGCGGNSTAFAASSSSVLTDLQRDPAFDVSAYPVVLNDFKTVDFLQLAESTNDEVYVYVYIPSQRFELTTIRLGFENKFDLGARWDDYDLTLLDSDGALYKYRVEGVTVSDENVRYYSIVCLHRKWVEGIDEESGNDNTIDEVPCPVEEIWTAYMLNGEVAYHSEFLDCIEVTDYYNDFLRYENGFKLQLYDPCDAHYIAFNTDRPMDRLIEADVEYVSQSYEHTTYIIAGGKPDDLVEGKPETLTAYLSENDTASTKADGLFATKYTWNRIEKASDFLKNEKLTDVAKAGVEGKAWVLRFTETAYELRSYSNMVTEKKTIISNVTILRLYFETDGVFFNLGVISDKASGDDIPGNPQGPDILDILERIWNFLKDKWWFWVIVALLFFAILSPFIPVFALILKGIFQVVVFIISAPFRFIAWIFKRRKD